MDNDKKSDYLIASILVTIFCCQPFGIVAIVYSALAKSSYSKGDYDEGEHYSSVAKKWIIASICIGAIIVLPYFFCVILGLTFY